MLSAVVALAVCGCDKAPLEDYAPAYTYILCVSFEDASGNDLVAPLGEERYTRSNAVNYWTGDINPNKYMLDVKYSQLPASAPAYVIPNNSYPRLGMGKFDNNYQCISHFVEQYEEEGGKYYLFSELSLLKHSWGLDTPRQDYIIYNISCPTIFGDNSFHELVAYWDDDPVYSTYGDEYPECVEAEFDGYKINVKKALYHSVETRNYYAYFIDIVLDK